MSFQLQAELRFLQKLLLLFYFPEFKRPILIAEPNNTNNVRFRKSKDFQYSSHILSVEFLYISMFIYMCVYVYLCMYRYRYRCIFM